MTQIFLTEQELLTLCKMQNMSLQHKMKILNKTTIDKIFNKFILYLRYLRKFIV